MNIVPTFPSPRHVNFQRRAVQTKLEGGHERGVRRVGFGKRCTGTSLNSLMNSDFKKKKRKKCRPSVQTCRRALRCVRSGELQLRSSVRRKLDGPPCSGSATLPTTHLCFSHRHSSRYLFSPPFCFTGKVTGRGCGGSAAAQLLFCSDTHLSAD